MCHLRKLRLEYSLYGLLTELWNFYRLVYRLQYLV